MIRKEQIPLFIRERLAVVASSPYLPDFQFVCAPGIERATGRAQAAGAVEGLQEMGIFGQVVGVTYDTTPSNSSPAVGTVALLEEVLGYMILHLACRHHIYDLRGKKARKVILGGRTLGPGHPLFVRLQNEWPNLIEVIDYANLARLDEAAWEGTFVEGLIEEVKAWCIDTWANESFSRGSYRDILHAIMAYLDVRQANFQFSIKKPKPVSNARFGEPAIYYLTLALLSQQLPWLTPQQRQEVDQMAFISALFYGPGFLKSHLGHEAAYNDLTSIHHDRQLREWMPQVANELLSTWDRHLDYLSPPLIVLALLSRQFSNEVKNGLRLRLLELLPGRVDPLPTRRGVSTPGPNFAKGDAFWPQDNSLPDISQFVSEESFLIFNVMKMEDGELAELLGTPVENWSSDIASPNYSLPFAVFEKFAKKMHYDNDAAER